MFEQSKKVGFVRTLPALIVAAGLGLSLVSCAASDPASACTPLLSAGSAASQVDATGSLGAEPDTTFPTPLIATEPQVATITAGDGDVLEPGQIVDMQITIYSAANGSVVTSSSYDETQPVRRTTGDDDIFAAATQCASVGSRLALAAPASAVFANPDTLGQLESQFGIDADDSLVAIIDIQRGFLGKANGADQFPQAGFPSIALAPNGQPGFTIPNQDPPTDLMISVLKQGSGDTVEKNDKVVLHYSGVLWDSGVQFDSSWERGAPVTFTAVSIDESDTGVVPGFAKALIGQKVGSQVIVVIPPSEGYPAGSEPASVPAGSTMVFVFDILGIE